MFEEHLAKLAQALDRKSFPYMLIGGQAVLVHGEPRLTRDLDVTLAADTGRLPALLDLIRELGWQPLPSNPDEFVEQTLVLPCEDGSSGIKMDFIFGLTPYEHGAVKRAVSREIKGVPVRFASVEDLVIHKLIAGRPRDIEDVEGVLAKNRILDQAMVRETLGEFARELGLPLVETFGALLAKRPPMP